jgi:hypothetical protein
MADVDVSSGQATRGVTCRDSQFGAGRHPSASGAANRNRFRAALRQQSPVRAADQRKRHLDDRLHEAHADPETRRLWRAMFLYMLRDRHGRPLLALPPAERPTRVDLLEKTPRGALNIPFLLKVFPNARFILLYREPRANVASLVEAWKVGLQTGRFVTFQDLPGWDRAAWCFLLPPGWRSMIGKSLVEIAAFQWEACNRIILDQLARLPRERWTAVSYPELVGDPSGVRGKLCRFINPDLESDSVPLGTLPLSRTTLTPPHPEKWKKYEGEMTALLPDLDAVIRRIDELRETGPD